MLGFKKKKEGICSNCGSKGDIMKFKGIPVMHESLLNKQITKCKRCQALVCLLCLMEQKGNNELPNGLKQTNDSPGFKVFQLSCPKCGSEV